MNKSKIEWCDMTFNPITGCLRGCDYCYARGIAQRFGGWTLPHGLTLHEPLDGETGILDMPLEVLRKTGNWQKAPFPYDFTPTFYRYRLNEPTSVKKPQTIFVGSMTDLFGYWVPDEWIKAVFEACAAAPWHRYLFLTKNPSRHDYTLSYYLPWNVDYGELVNSSNMWFGFTAENQTTFDMRCAEQDFYVHPHYNSYVSLEPLQSEIELDALGRNYGIGWVIAGAESGNRKGKIIPKHEWIESIAEQCRAANVPLFMKNSLRGLMGDAFVQETPW